MKAAEQTLDRYVLCILLCFRAFFDNNQPDVVGDNTSARGPNIHS